MKPIVFNNDEVKAILNEKKSASRRVLAEKGSLDKHHGLDREPYKLNGVWYYDMQTAINAKRIIELKTPYKIGDMLYVRETWLKCDLIDFNGNIIEKDAVLYKADEPNIPSWGTEEYSNYKWRPSIHMPKELARIFLKVTDTRVERLQDIGLKDIIDEGIEMSTTGKTLGQDIDNTIDNFKNFWNSKIRKQDLSIYGWDANPWVWVIEFERISKEEDYA